MLRPVSRFLTRISDSHIESRLEDDTAGRELRPEPRRPAKTVDIKVIFVLERLIERHDRLPLVLVQHLEAAEVVARTVWHSLVAVSPAHDEAGPSPALPASATLSVT